jgi:hypothetical protein
MDQSGEVRGEPMRSALTGLMVLVLAVCASADQLTLVTGQVVTGQFVGFKNHQFVFQDSAGAERKDFAAGVKNLKVDAPIKVSAHLMSQSMNEALFTGYDKFNVRLIKDGREFSEPATLLKRIDLAFDAQRTVEDISVVVISRGEAVDIEQSLKPGRVNVVFFHFPQAHSSVRQGNYVELMARESRGRTVILKLLIPGWEAPVCMERGIKSLPQFWFYSRSGRLLKKLTDRFTEADIDEAFKEAQRSL